MSNNPKDTIVDWSKLVKNNSFQYKDLNGKTLLIKVIDNEDGLCVGGTDVNTGITYMLLTQIKPEKE